MFLVLGRFAYELAKPLIVAVLIGVVLMALFGFDPVSLLQDWLFARLRDIEIWVTCEVIGVC